MIDEFVLLEANPRHLGIVREIDGKWSLVQWCNGEAWMKSHEIISEREYRSRHPAYLESRDQPLYDLFEERTIAEEPEPARSEPTETAQPNNERRQELESLKVKQLKLLFQPRGDYWRKFANSTDKQGLIKQLLTWEGAHL